MQRRDFLISMMAGAVATTLPLDILAAPAPDPIKWNATTLATEMEKMFSCRMGPPAAFFEIVKSTDSIIESNPYELAQPRTEEQLKTLERFTYQTYAIGIENGSAEEAEAKLAKYFHDIFSSMPATKLVWRTKPQFVSDELIEYGEAWATAEEIEDRLKSLEEKPEGVEYDFVSGNYCHVVRKVQFHKMRMRLAMTDLETPAEIDCIKNEGTTFTTRIS